MPSFGVAESSSTKRGLIDLPILQIHDYSRRFYFHKPCVLHLKSPLDAVVLVH